MRKGSLWVVLPLLVLSWMVTGCEKPDINAGDDNSGLKFEKIADLNLSNGMPLMDIVVKDNYIYAVDANIFGSKLYVVDISNPKAPNVVKEINATLPNRLDIKGDHLYMVDREPYRLEIFDITTPFEPQSQSSLLLEYNLSAIKHVKLEQTVSKYRYAFTFKDQNYSDQNKSSFTQHNIQVFAKDNNYTYVWFDGMTFQIDTSDVTDPKVHNHYTLGYFVEGLLGWFASSNIYVKDDILTSTRLYSYRDFNLSSQIIQATRTVAHTTWYPTILKVNDYYYGARGTVSKINVAKHGTDEEDAMLVTQGSVIAMEHNGTHLFTSHSKIGEETNNSYQGIEIFNISNPADIKKSQAFATPSAVLAMALKDKYLFTVSKSGMLTIYQANPVAAGTNTIESTEGTTDIDKQFLADFIGVDVNSPIFTTPTAVVVAEKNVTVGTTVTLDGTQSEDPNGDALTFAWTLASKPGASTAALSSTDANITSFTADANGTYLVSLVVKNDGNFTAERNVTITAYALVDDTPPVIEEDPTVTDNNVTATRVGSIQTATIAEEITGLEGTYNYKSIAYSIALGTNHVFVGALDGLSAVNLSPIELNSTYSAMGIAYAVAVNGNYAYVADDVEGASFHLYTLNISNPASITMESNQTLGSLTTDLVVSGDYLYAATGDRLEIFNIRDTNATAPVSEGNYTAQGMSAYNLVIDGNYTYLTSYDGGLEIINITNPANPVKEGNYTNDDWAHDVAISGNYAYVSNNISGTLVLDISNKATPTLVTTIDTNDSMDAVAIDGDYLFITDTGAGILIYDVSTPATPLLVGTIVMGNNTANDMVVRDGFLYTAENNGSMGVYELTYPSAQTDTFTYTVSTFAGSGTPSYIDATGTSASFDSPRGIIIDTNGDIIVTDTGNHRIRKISSAGVVTTIAGNGTETTVDGVGTAASIREPTGMAMDAQGNIYIATWTGPNIRKMTPDGNVTTFAGANIGGNFDAMGTNALFTYPRDIAIDTYGNLFVIEYGNHKIRKITLDGNVTTFAGSGASGATDAVGTTATFSGPRGITIDSQNNLYVSDTGNNKIRKITPDGNVTTFAGSSTAGSTDAIGTAASFNAPYGIAMDASGNFYVADAGNHIIRKITAEGAVTTVAGTAGMTGSTDATGADARFNEPNGIAIDSSGNLYVTDSGNHKIRKIVP